MSHLGRWLSAQVDGELDGIERDRVLNHMAGCAACREEAVALRMLKRRMVALGDSDAGTAIAGRLIERARSDRDLIDLTSDQEGFQLPRSRPIGGLAARQSWLSWRVATGSAGTALAAIGVLAFVLGGSPADSPAPRVSPAVDAYWNQHSYDTGQAQTIGATGAQARRPSAPAMVAPGSVAALPSGSSAGAGAAGNSTFVGGGAVFGAEVGQVGVPSAHRPGSP